MGQYIFQKNVQFLASFSLFCLFYKKLTINMFNKKCQWLDLNPGPLNLEATALSTVPHHCPIKYNIFIYHLFVNSTNEMT